MCSPCGRPPHVAARSPRTPVAIFNAIAAVVGVIAPVVMFVLSSAGVTEGRSLCCADPNTPMAQGAELGVWSLLGVTFLVQLGFGIFFLNLRRRLRLVRDPLPRPVFRLIKGGAPSAGALSDANPLASR